MSESSQPKVKTTIVKQRQKNGDIYVLERKTIYVPEKRYNKVLSSKFISKIIKGTEQEVPTRPRRKKEQTNEVWPQNNSEVQAQRVRVGMTDIIEHIGDESGMDQAVYSNTDKGTAQKVLSLARYIFATDGAFLSWNKNISARPCFTI